MSCHGDRSYDGVQGSDFNLLDYMGGYFFEVFLYFFVFCLDKGVKSL